MSCRGVEVERVNELDWTISCYVDSGMRERMIGAWCASEWLDWMFFLLHSPFDLRHSDFSVAFVWFFTLIGCFPHRFLFFLGGKWMTAGISFCILRNSEMLWGRPNHLWRKGECRINAPASHSFLRFLSFFPFCFSFMPLNSFHRFSWIVKVIQSH